MKRAFMLVASLVTLAACQTTTTPSESYYTSSEAMRSQSVDRCTVLEARRITIGAEPLQRSSGYGYARAAGQPEEQIGMLVGAVLVGAIGHQLDDDAGAAIGAAIGGTVGRAQGSRMAARRMAMPGVEYSVLLGDGREKIIAQPLNAGDRIAQPGTTCRISRGPNGDRVLPGAHMPTQVNRPRQTGFID